MLKRFLRGRGEGNEPFGSDARTYLERLLDAALPLVPARGDGAPQIDPVGTLGEALIAAEVANGLANPPTGEPAREQLVRTYTTLLLDNDRNPPQLQLSGRDLERPRALLAAFFTGAASMHTEAQVVLRFIEDRFGQGRFGQARLLLQLFDTDQPTRRSNERNLFYEEMALRMTGERSSALTDGTIAETRAELSEAADFGVVADTLARRVGIRLNAFAADPVRSPLWVNALAGDSAGAEVAIRRLVPGARWRNVSLRDPVESIGEQLAERGTRHAVLNMIRSVYFVTLAPGETGFEHLVMTTLRWLEANFDVVATRVLPRLHKTTTLGDASIADTLEAIWDDDLAGAPLTARQFEAAEIAAQLDAIRGELAHIDLRAIPEGDFDLGGIVQLRLLGLETGDLTTALRLHRLT